jgi:hypothetical protein
LFLLLSDIWEKYKDANVATSILYAICRDMIERDSAQAAAAPRHLAICTDNGSEYINRWMLALCALMVDCGWFATIEYVMNIPGHTHGRIDAQHGQIKAALVERHIATLPQLVEAVRRRLHTPETIPTIVYVKDVADFKKLLNPGLAKLQGHKPPHHFLFQRSAAVGTVELFVRDYSHHPWQRAIPPVSSQSNSTDSSASPTSVRACTNRSCLARR